MRKRVAPLKQDDFEFNRDGELTIYRESISHSRILQIIKLSVACARHKKIRKPRKWRFIPTLTEVA